MTSALAVLLSASKTRHHAHSEAARLARAGMPIFFVAGDKAGNWKRWYKVNIPKADDLFDQHIENIKKGHD